MLKNKFKRIVIFTILIVAFTLPIVWAENEITNNTVVTSEDNSDLSANSSTFSEENFKENDIYLTGNDVTIDYIVDGNLFVVANHVTINSQIGGDAFICANSVTIGEQGYIFSNLFTFSKNVRIDGRVYDLYSACENIFINGYVYRDIHVGSNSIHILGTIGRNAYVESENLDFIKDGEENLQGKINGNLNYTANQEFSIPEGVVTGETNFKQNSSFDNNTIEDYFMMLGTFVITVIAIWLLCLWLTPKFLKNNTSLLTTKKILPVIGFGLLTPIIIILLTIIFFMLGITSNLSLLLILVLIILFAISNSIFIITLNTIICHKLKLEKTLQSLGMLVASSVILWLIGLIPIIGFILRLVVIILGFGITISSLILKEKERKL